MQLEFSQFVEEDLEAIGDFIAEHSPMRAVSFVREIRQKLRFVAENPYLYHLRSEIGEGARIATHGRYLILFQVIDDLVKVERIVSGSRDLTQSSVVRSGQRKET